MQITFFVHEPHQSGGVASSKTFAAARFIKLRTFSSKTRLPIRTKYALEHKAGNRYAYTKTDGTCLFNRKYFPELSLVFSKTGYLSREVRVDRTTNVHVGDTLKLDVYLDPVRVVEKITYNHIYFYTDTDVFKLEASTDLEKLWLFLHKNDSVLVEIQGHMNFSKAETANIYQRLYNNDLSYRRAKAVFEYLIQKGIDSKRLTYIGMSNHKMVYPIPKTKREADMNKRVEIWTLERI